MPDRIGGTKVKGSQVYGFVRGVISSVERDADKALLQDVTAPHIHFNGAVAELAVLNPGNPVFAFLREVNAASSCKRSDLAIHGTNPSSS